MRFSRLLALSVQLSALSLALLVPAAAQQTTALVDATTGEMKRPTAAEFRAANDLAQASTTVQTNATGFVADTTASPASDDWLVLRGATYGTRQLPATYYRNASVLNVGTLPDARLSWSLSAYGKTLTAAADAAAARTTLALGNVDNTSDATKNAATAMLTNKDLSAASNTYRAASESVTGAVELATAAEIITGTDTTRSVTPQLLARSQLLAAGSSMGMRQLAFQEPDGAYTAWPYGCFFYDQSAGSGTGRFIQLYTAGTSHVSNDKKVYARRRGATADQPWGARILVADATGSSLGSTVHAAGKMPNGNYIALVRRTDAADAVQGYYLYRSTDQALTWSSLGQWVVDGENFSPAEAGDFFVTSSNSILTYCRSWSTGINYICRSTDNGATWTKATLSESLTGSPVSLEGKFFQIADGTIVSLVRQDVTSYPYTAQAAAYTVSTDDGVTWSSLAASNLSDMSNGNAGVIYDVATDTVEIYYSSRAPNSYDGLGSIYYSWTTGARAKTGDFGVPVRLFVGAPTRDFGYPAVAQSDDGFRLLTWYDGNSTATAIFEARAQIQRFGKYSEISASRFAYNFEPFAAASSRAMSPNAKYVAMYSSLQTYTLPSNAEIGSTLELAGYGSGGWRISQASGQIIRSSTSATTSGASGYLASANRYDAVRLVCVVPSKEWVVVSSIGSLSFN